MRRDSAPLSRRAFVRAGLVGGAAACLLTACGQISPTQVGSPTGVARQAGTAASGVTLPAYIPFQGLKPDLPGSAEGVDPAYFTIPQNLVKTVPNPPGDGGEVTAWFWQSSGSLGALRPPEGNVGWQAVNKGTGVTLKLLPTPPDSYTQGINVAIAGGNLADLMYLYSGTPIRNVADFMKAKCADLTPYLSGDSIKDFPNLATFPTHSWRGGVFGGALYGVPIPRNPFERMWLIRKDLWDKHGGHQPTSAADLKSVLQALTSPSEGRWGTASAGVSWYSHQAYLQVFRAPNSWKVDSGKLIKDVETEEYKATVAYLRDLVVAGVYHPDTPGMASSQRTTKFQSGAFVFYSSSPGDYENQWNLAALAAQSRQDIVLGSISPFDSQGGTPLYHFGPGNFGFTVIKKSSPARERMLLGVLNYLAAPFGSEEYMTINYGVKGTSYNLDEQGVPVLTEQGKNDIILWRYITSNAPVIFNINRSKEWATDNHATQQAMAKAGIADPTHGIYSPTMQNEGVSFNQEFFDGVADIIAGRRPMNDFDALATKWKASGGDQARGEFEKALAAAN